MLISFSEKFLKRVIGRTDLEDGIKTLDKLTNEEVAMASAQLLKVAHVIDKNVTEVNEGVRRVDENVVVVKSEVQLVNDNIKAVDDKVQTMADGRQRFTESTAVNFDLRHLDGMATAKEVKLILQQTVDGVENVKLVNDNVKAVDDRVKTIADGEHRRFGESVASSRHRLSSLSRLQVSRQGSEGSPSRSGRRSGQHEAFVINSPSLTIQLLTSLQGSNYGKVLGNGNLQQIRPRISNSWAIVNTRVLQSGLSKATSATNGRRPALCCGFMGNVCFFLQGFGDLMDHIFSSAGSGKSVLWFVVPPRCSIGKLIVD